MILGPVDMKAVESVLHALTDGIRRAEAETADGRRVTGYYVGPLQIRIDIVEKS